MLFLQLIPVVLSLLVLGAHFLRSGGLVVTLVMLVMIGLLGLRRLWVPRLVQVVLLIGAVEWLRSLVTLAIGRARLGEPYARMVVILGIVALVTGLSALVLNSERARAWYGALDDEDDDAEEDDDSEPE